MGVSAPGTEWVRKRPHKKWAMLTAYDAPTAELLEKAGIDLILVGDSVGMVLLGYASTVEVTMDQMIHHAKAVRRGAGNTFIIGDMPLKGVEKGPRQALESAKRFVGEARLDAVKLEWRKDCLRTTDLLVRHRIPVMGHIGLTPQSAGRTGGFKVRGQSAAEAFKLVKMAGQFQDHGVFSLLLECVPHPVAGRITEESRVPTIGIGAGPHCDGQVLVFQDLVGLFEKFTPRFVKRYVQSGLLMKKAVARYIGEVRRGRFPSRRHSFGMKTDELARFRRLFEGTSKGGR